MPSSLPDFDQLLLLAKEDPSQLEQLKRQLVQEVIDNAGDTNKNRLQGLQFKIDMEIRRTSNPLASCMKISSMMHESSAKLSAFFDQPKSYAMAQPATQLKSAKVICLQTAKLENA